MIMLCIRGAALYLLAAGSMVFWLWVLMPATRGTHGSQEYFQKQDNFTMMFGGFGLLICIGFIFAVAFHYVRRVA